MESYKNFQILSRLWNLAAKESENFNQCFLQNQKYLKLLLSVAKGDKY